MARDRTARAATEWQWCAEHQASEFSEGSCCVRSLFPEGRITTPCRMVGTVHVVADASHDGDLDPDWAAHLGVDLDAVVFDDTETATESRVVPLMDALAASVDQARAARTAETGGEDPNSPATRGGTPR